MPRRPFKRKRGRNTVKRPKPTLALRIIKYLKQHNSALSLLRSVKRHAVLLGLIIAVLALVVGLLDVFAAPEIRRLPGSFPSHKHANEMKLGNPTELIVYLTQSYKNYSFFKEGYIKSAEVLQPNLKGRVQVLVEPMTKNVLSPREEKTVTLQLRVLLNESAKAELISQGRTAELHLTLYDNLGRPIELHPGHTDVTYLTFTVSDRPDVVPNPPTVISPH